MSEKVLKHQSQHMGKGPVDGKDIIGIERGDSEYPQILEDIIEEVGLDDEGEIKLVQALITAEQYKGPIPHPNIIAGYEEILPGSADRILSMAENESNHRHEMEKNFYKTDSRDSLLGIICALVLGLSCIGGGVTVMILVPEIMGMVTGTIVVGSGLAAIVGTFLKGTETTWKKDNQSDKNE